MTVSSVLQTFSKIWICLLFYNINIIILRTYKKKTECHYTFIISKFTATNLKIKLHWIILKNFHVNNTFCNDSIYCRIYRMHNYKTRILFKDLNYFPSFKFQMKREYCVLFLLNWVCLVLGYEKYFLTSMLLIYLFIIILLFFLSKTETEANVKQFFLTHRRHCLRTHIAPLENISQKNKSVILTVKNFMVCLAKASENKSDHAAAVPSLYISNFLRSPFSNRA